MTYTSLAHLLDIKKQRVVELFSGDSLNERWNFNNIAGAGSGAMVDAIDGGYRITTGSTTSNASQIDFNGINQYDSEASGFITTLKTDNTGSFDIRGGLVNTDGNALQKLTTWAHHTNTNFEFLTSGSSATSIVDGGIALDTSWHEFRGGVFANTHASFWMDNTFAVISTTNLPTVNLQPALYVQTEATGAEIADIRYMECWNN